MNIETIIDGCKNRVVNLKQLIIVKYSQFGTELLTQTLVAANVLAKHLITVQGMDANAPSLQEQLDMALWSPSKRAIWNPPYIPRSIRDRIVADQMNWSGKEMLSDDEKNNEEDTVTELNIRDLTNVRNAFDLMSDTDKKSDKKTKTISKKKKSGKKKTNKKSKGKKR